MRQVRWLTLLVLPFAMLACGLSSGLQKIRSAATELPAMLTEAPTALGPMETAVAKYTPDVAMTPSAGHLGIPLSRPQQVMTLTQEFVFAPGTVDGQPAVLATLTSTGETTFQKLKGAVAQFIGDPNNLSRIVVIAPGGDSEAQGEASGLVTLVVSSSLPPESKVEFITWLATNFEKVQQEGPQQTVINGLQISLKSDQGNYIAELQPAGQ
jgi:hypothetical protein